MKGRLFVVEGATASGKNTLLDKLSNEGFTVMRGIPSQNPAENVSLMPAAKEVIGNTEFNLRATLAKPPVERDQIIRRFIKASMIQHGEAFKLRSDGETVFLNRSAISLIAIIGIPLAISDPARHEELKRWTEQMLIYPRVLESELLNHIDGIVLMKTSSVGGKEREGMSGVQEIESATICKEIERLTAYPVVELNATVQSVEEEFSAVKSQLLGISLA